MIRQIKTSDSEAICRIYNGYIVNTTITFEENILTAEDMVSRIENITHDYPWFIYEEEEKVVGYAYAGKWKERSAYRYAVEIAVYLDTLSTGKGIGTKLLEELLKELKLTSVHSLIAGIALPNPASIALFEKFGFKNIGLFSEVGFKFNKWIDVGYWELIL